MSLNGEQFGEEAQELTVCYYADVSKKIQIEKQLLQLESTLSHKMSHDPVTGMLNHHSMFQTLNSEVSRSRRYDNPLSLVLMKVDFQSESNMTEEKREQMRLVISQLLKDQMRWADIVGHLDDFDFVFIT
ncbi:GGDEF domain-containing protein [sulfur-oxidizing endosymbiont of Gigantopelta aegis]|uniref:GGDEF domain-containing protein n=1 Tax=sulfur-oxidizing endosymbiont of Gigantopelta aegis TaxID=2794934 RepID=UPI0018DD1A3B|nr:GGDEF domain-containing protein [sulfur-oxidizing endosymbiont of Gigantopelta aegis]